MRKPSSGNGRTLSPLRGRGSPGTANPLPEATTSTPSTSTTSSAQPTTCSAVPVLPACPPADHDEDRPQHAHHENHGVLPAGEGLALLAVALLRQAAHDAVLRVPREPALVQHGHRLGRRAPRDSVVGRVEGLRRRPAQRDPQTLAAAAGGPDADAALGARLLGRGDRRLAHGTQVRRHGERAQVGFVAVWRLPHPKPVHDRRRDLAPVGSGTVDEQAEPWWDQAGQPGGPGGLAPGTARRVGGIGIRPVDASTIRCPSAPVVLKA